MCIIKFDVYKKKLIIDIGMYNIDLYIYITIYTLRYFMGNIDMTTINTYSTEYI